MSVLVTHFLFTERCLSKSHKPSLLPSKGSVIEPWRRQVLPVGSRSKDGGRDLAMLCSSLVELPYSGGVFGPSVLFLPL